MTAAVGGKLQRAKAAAQSVGEQGVLVFSQADAALLVDQLDDVAIGVLVKDRLSRPFHMHGKEPRGDGA